MPITEFYLMDHHLFTKPENIKNPGSTENGSWSAVHIVLTNTKIIQGTKEKNHTDLKNSAIPGSAELAEKDQKKKSVSKCCTQCF